MRQCNLHSTVVAIKNAVRAEKKRLHLLVHYPDVYCKGNVRPRVQAGLIASLRRDASIHAARL